MDLESWLKSGAYLPRKMRDFHDQKDVFKALFDTIRIPENLKHISWVDAHIFTIDIFLWWMARRGYTLQKSRSRQDFFVDFDKSVADAKERRDARDIELLRSALTPKPDSAGASQDG
jgi:hypothetical protein